MVLVEIHVAKKTVQQQALLLPTEKEEKCLRRLEAVVLDVGWKFCNYNLA